MRYRVVSIISAALLIITAMLFSVVLTTQPTMAASLKQGHKTGARHAHVQKLVKPAIVARPAIPSADLTIKVAHQGQGCVKYNRKVVFTILVSNIKGAQDILSDTITVVFREPGHLVNLSLGGYDWSFHKDGSYYTATYIGSYPVKNGKQLGLITVSGTVNTTQGGSSTLAAAVSTPNEVDLANNTDSSKTTLCNNNGSSSSHHSSGSSSSSSSSSSGSSSGSSSSSLSGSSSSSLSGSSSGSFPGLPLTGSDPL